MRVSEIKTTDLAEYLRVDECKEIENMLVSAKAYVKSYAGLTDEQLDEHEDITHAIFVLVADMYDNRELIVKSEKANKVVTSILNMYSTNLL